MENRKAIAQLKIRVQWGDMDALQHLNNTVYLRWVESTRLLFFDQLIDGTVGKAAIGPILAWQDIKYIAPVVYPDTVHVFFNITALEEDRIQGEAELFSMERNRLVALSKNTLMAYDTSERKKAAIPKHWREKIISFYGPSIALKRTR